MAGRIDDKRILVISLHNNGILCAEVIRWQFVRPPVQPLIGVRQEFNQGELLSVFDSAVDQVASPNVAQQLTIVVIEETNIGQEC